MARNESEATTASASQPESVALNRPSEVIYQIYPASFKDSGETPREGDYERYRGWGDLKGIKSKLQYIRDLGVDAIWISPFFLTPHGDRSDGGYAVTNYREVDPRFGTMEDFKALLKEAHEKGLRVYTDFVVCHTSDDHEWFKASHDPNHARHEEYKDYYVWCEGKVNEKGELVNGYNQPLLKKGKNDYIVRDERHPDGSEIKSYPAEPNNWLSVFNGPAWEWDKERGEYYMHHFYTSQPALNLNDPAVQDASIREMKFWLDMGVDGVRIDALPYANFKDIREDDKGSNTHWMGQQHTSSMCWELTEKQFLPKIRALADSYYDPQRPGSERKRLIVEGIAGKDFGGGGDIEQAARYLDPEKGADSVYTNALVNLFYGKSDDEPHHRYPSSVEVRDTLLRIFSLSPDGGYCNNLSNHDFPRYSGRMGENFPKHLRSRAVKQFLMLTAALPGSLCLYQGDELGLTQASKEDLNPEYLKQFLNGDGSPKYPNGKKQDLLDGEANRDGCRTPMPWEAETKPHMDFTDHPDPYLPIPASHKPRAVDQQEWRSNSMLNITRRILQQRKDNPALTRGKATILKTYDPIVLFVRETDNEAVLCAFNMSGMHQEFNPMKVPGLGDNPELLRKLGLKDNPELEKLGENLEGRTEINESDRVYLPPFGSSFIGLRREHDKADEVEVGMETLPLNKPDVVSVEVAHGDGSDGQGKRKIIAADMLITDIHLTEAQAREALDSIINGKANQERGDDYKIRIGEKATINAGEYLALMKAAEATGSPEITAGGSTSCVLGTLKKLVEDISVKLVGLLIDDEEKTFGNVIKQFLKQAEVQVIGHWPKGEPPTPTVSFIIDHGKGRKPTILTYCEKEIKLFEQNRQNYPLQLMEKEIKESKTQDIIYLPESTLSKFGLGFIEKVLEWRGDKKDELVLALPTTANFGPGDSGFFKYLIPDCNIVMGNDVEFNRIISGKYKSRDDIEEKDIDAIADWLQKSFIEGEKILERDGIPHPYDQVAFITRGKEGALIVTKEGKQVIPGVKLDGIENMVGGGNAAIAGFLSAHLNGLTHFQAAEEGMRRAAEKIAQPGREPFIRKPKKSWAISLAPHAHGAHGYARGGGPHDAPSRPRVDATGPDQ